MVKQCGSSIHVEERQLGPPHHAHRHVQPAPLPAGKLPDPLARVPGQADHRDQLVGIPRTAGLAVGVRRVVAAEVREQLADPELTVVAPRARRAR